MWSKAFYAIKKGTSCINPTFFFYHKAKSDCVWAKEKISLYHIKKAIYLYIWCTSYSLFRGSTCHTVVLIRRSDSTIQTPCKIIVPLIHLCYSIFYHAIELYFAVVTSCWESLAWLSPWECNIIRIRLLIVSVFL